jgi:hypothetical protein
MDFEKEEFDGLMLPVHTLAEDVDILTKYPELKKYHDFTEYLPEKNKALRYIAYFYDKNTPLKKIDNILSRKAEAAKLAGYIITDGKFDEAVEEILACENTIVNAMIVRYLRLSNNHKFAMLSTTIELLYRNLKAQLDEEGGDYKEAQTMEKEISRITAELLQSDTNQFLTADLYQMIDLEKLALSSEDVAARIRDALPGIAYNPYI